METTGGGILGRLGEKVLGWVALALIVLLGVGIWRMGPEARGAILDGIWRTLCWIVVAAALPWSARLFIGRLLAVGSNWAGFGLLAVFAVVDVVAGLALMGGLPTGGWGWFAGLAALAVAGTYNYWVAEYLAETSGR
jgi:hypothetical protein